ncbi:MAG: hypothetical protein AB1486_35110 [Planctomycetota bacterium]
MNAYCHRWAPLSDLPDDWRDLRCEALENLASIWAEQRERLHEHEALRKFTYLDNPEALERQFREWLSRTINLALEQWRKQL